MKFKLRNKVRPDGTYPVVLQIIKDRKKREVYTGYYSTLRQFENQEFTRAYPNRTKANVGLLELKKKASDIIAGLKQGDSDFSLDDFVNALKNKPKSNYVLDYMKSIIEERMLSNSIGTAKTEKDTLNAMKRIEGFQTLKFHELNYDWLRNFEAHLRSRGNTNGGISVKMRVIRTMLNRAIKSGLMKKDKYPFDDYKISSLKSTPNKRSLTKDQFISIRDLNLKGHQNLLLSKLIFLFSFYSRGINFYDIMLLEWKNIEGDQLRYVRRKTKAKFQIELLKSAQDILAHFKAVSADKKYVFPLLVNENPSALQLHNRKEKMLKKYNSDLKVLAELAGINVPLTSYVSRHSYATIMKMSGTSSDIISQSMGHSSVDVTNAYLKSFDSDMIDEANRKLNDL